MCKPGLQLGDFLARLVLIPDTEDLSVTPRAVLAYVLVAQQHRVLIASYAADQLGDALDGIVRSTQPGGFELQIRGERRLERDGTRVEPSSKRCRSDA